MFWVSYGILARSIFGFFFKHVPVNIHPLSSPFSWWAFRHGILTPLKYI
jgi:hypothetical protein